MEPTLSRALHLMNGDAVHENIKRGQVVAKFVKEDLCWALLNSKEFDFNHSLGGYPGLGTAKE
jgi:hypothetical protein